MNTHFPGTICVGCMRIRGRNNKWLGNRIGFTWNYYDNYFTTHFNQLLEYKNKYGTYGVFELPEGVLRSDWFESPAN